MPGIDFDCTGNTLNQPKPFSAAPRSTAARRRRALSIVLAGFLAGAVAIAGESLRPVSTTPPPVAPEIAAPLQEQTALIELDGTASESPDGGVLTYLWRQIEGPKVELSDPTVAKPYFRTGKPGFYRFELVVTANGLESDPFFVDLEIERQNLPPVAKAPREIRGEVGKPLEIDAGESFDPEGEKLTYRWRSLTMGLDLPASVRNQPVLSFEPELDGVFEIELIVSDGEAISQPFITTLTIKPKPRPPVAKGTIVALKIPTAPQPAYAMAPPAGAKPMARIDGPAVARLGEAVLLDGRTSRGSGNSRLEYLWRQKSGPFVNDFELVFDSAAERFTPVREGDYEFELVVSDGGVESDPVAHKVRVVSGEMDPPVAVVVAPARAMPGALVKMDATQSYDLEGSPLVYRWRQTGGPKVTNYVIDQKIGDAAPAFHPPTAGVYSFELVVSNGKRQSKPVEIDIEVGDARRPPTLSIGGPEVVNTGDRLELAALSNQPNLAFAWRQVEGPTQILPPSNGDRISLLPSLPGRYVFDLAALENGRVVANTSRVLEVFGSPAAQSGRPVAPQPLAPQNIDNTQGALFPASGPELSPLLDMPNVQPIGSGYVPPTTGGRLPESAPSSGGRVGAQIHPSLGGGLLSPNGPSPLEPLPSIDSF